MVAGYFFPAGDKLYPQDGSSVVDCKSLALWVAGLGGDHHLMAMFPSPALNFSLYGIIILNRLRARDQCSRSRASKTEMPAFQF